MSPAPKTTFKSQTIISQQLSRARLEVIIRELEALLRCAIPGDITEFGCYVGTASLFIRRALNEAAQSSPRRFFAYDSFAGLPRKQINDSSSAGSQFVAGELSVSKKQFLQEFHKARLEPPITIKAWFKDLTPEQLPEQIAFAFLDGDFYESIKDSLKLVWPRLSPGGVIAIDDYQTEALPGVEKAVREFFLGKRIDLRQEHNIAIIKKS